MDKVAVLIPCYNEELTIGKVVKDFKTHLPEAVIYVYDNNSTDKTADIAKEHGAIVRYERKQGKGNVMRSMFRDIDAECYILVDGDEYSPEHEKMMHKAIKKVTSDIEEMKFNTSVAEFMKMTNEFYKDKKINKAEYKTFLQLLNPFAPHMTEELFSILGESKTINETPWPIYDEAKTIDDEIEIPVQVNGKVKAVVVVPKEASQEELKAIVDNTEAIQNAISGKNVVKEIYVKGKIYNIVVK